MDQRSSGSSGARSLIMENIPNTPRPTEVDIKEQPINQVASFDEVETNEPDAKKIFNYLSNFIIYLSSFKWGQIFDRLNKGIIGKKINPKDVYRIGFVERLKKIAKERQVLFAQDGNKLYIYNKEYWIQVSEGLIKEFLHKVATKMGIPTGYSSCVKFIKSVYEQLIESGFFEKMVVRNITYLNLRNGTLKICSKGIELVSFDPKHFLTYQLDFEYDLNAKNELWLDFLDMVLPDKDTQKTLQQAIGYLFIKDLKLEVVPFLYGIGANGKSVIFEVIKGLLDPSLMSFYSLTHLTNKLGYQLADLHNKLINYGSDINLKNIDLAIFKQLASGEAIGTRQIREKAFTMTSYAKMIFNINKLDDADIENTYGFFRRLLFIPFEVTIVKEQQDKKFHHKLLENKAGIMNWIIEGIEEVIKNEEIFRSTKCENFLENFKKEVSPIQLFLDIKCFEKTSSESNDIMDFQAVYELYREFCKEQGEKPVAQRNLNADLKKLGFERTRRKQGNVWFAKINSSK